MVQRTGKTVQDCGRPGGGPLELQGMALGYPYSSEIKGSKYAFRELRVRSRGSSLRVIYVFDPRRDAILLIGGDKTGRKRFYERIIPKAEIIWEEYLEEEYGK